MLIKNDNIKEHLMQSLPIGGVDGTLKRRMKNSFTHGNVRAKTGTLTGIISLAGYCKAANGHELCFAIINNGIMHGIMPVILQIRFVPCSVNRNLVKT